MGIRGIINIDLLLAFIFTISIFAVILNFNDSLNLNSIKQHNFEIETIDSISRSYELLSQICSGRDNEISLTKLITLSPSSVSLLTPNGYLYGEKLDCLYIKRAVYITELNEVGYIEVC